MDHVRHLECLVCAKQYGVGDINYVCPDHGAADGVVDVVGVADGLEGGGKAGEADMLPEKIRLISIRGRVPYAVDYAVP